MPEKANVQDDLNKMEVNKILKQCEGYNNLEVYQYSKMVHAKVLHVDGTKTFFGSANMNKKATDVL